MNWLTRVKGLHVSVSEKVTAPSLPPTPARHPVSDFYWAAAREHRLSLLRCQDCGHFVHFPRPICDRCQSIDLAPEDISGRGTLYTYTTVMQAGDPYFIDKVPYIVGLVEIAEEPGVRIPAGIEGDEADLHCGVSVEVFFVDVTDSLSLPFFRLAQGASS